MVDTKEWKGIKKEKVINIFFPRSSVQQSVRLLSEMSPEQSRAREPFLQIIYLQFKVVKEHNVCYVPNKSDKKYVIKGD